MKRMEIKGINLEITLHVGLGTFRSIEVEDLSKHKMDSEEINISKESCDIINKAKEKEKKICVSQEQQLIELLKVQTQQIIWLFHLKDGLINLYFLHMIFKLLNCMVSNFHLPKSTLLICRLIWWLRISNEGYKEAVRKNTNSILLETQC